jgi:hypothetical protein
MSLIADTILVDSFYNFFNYAWGEKGETCLKYVPGKRKTVFGEAFFEMFLKFQTSLPARARQVLLS